jgi:hypothetical protein
VQAKRKKDGTIEFTIPNYPKYKLNIMAKQSPTYFNFNISERRTNTQYTSSKRFM